MPSRYCQSCEALHESDFCPACRAYIAWDLAIGEETLGPAGETTTDEMAPPSVVRMVVRAGEIEVGDPEARDVLRVEPGATLVLKATVCNDSGVVDSFLVGVDGLPADWIEIEPATLHLTPTGSREDVVGEASIVVRAPRASSTRPGTWPFAVTVNGGDPASERARVSAMLTIGRFASLELDVHPQIAAGRRRASFACELRNLGNGEAPVRLVALDAGQACWLDVPDELSIAPGATLARQIGARPARTHWVGRPIDHRLQVEARTPDAPIVKAPVLVYRQRPWVAGWVPALILLLLVLALVLYLVLPRRVTMPALIGAQTAFAAQQRLVQAGLDGRPQIATRLSPAIAAGTVIGQLPSAGSQVRSSTAVTIVVAAAPATTIVPDLTGFEPARAEAALARVHLKLGTVSPRLRPKGRIASQLPAPGSLRRRGEAVDVVLARRRARVPNIRGRRLAVAERLLHRAGFALGAVSPRPRPGARVVSQLPTSGARAGLGTKVAVVVVQRTVIVPKLRGMTIEAAGAALEVCGLRLGPLPSAAKATQRVAAQVPGPGSHRQVGTAVTVVLGSPTKRSKGGAVAAPAPPTRKECFAR